MDIETMQTVCMVAITGSFSLVAEMIPCSQPTITRRIKMAEEELGVPIFDRHSKRKQVTLTVEGRQIVERFAQITKEYNDMLTLFKGKEKLSYPKSVVLGIAGNTMITSIGIDSMHRDFLTLYPNSSFSTLMETEDNIVSMLNLGKVDYALLVRYAWNNEAPFIHYYMDEKFRVTNFTSRDLLVGVSEDSELVGKMSLTMKDLAETPFIYSENIHNLPTTVIPTTHFLFFEACRKAGFTTKIKTVRPSRALRMQAVASGLGSIHCALPERLHAYSGIRYIKVADALFHADFFLMSDKSKSENEYNKVSDWLKSLFSEDS